MGNWGGGPGVVRKLSNRAPGLSYKPRRRRAARKRWLHYTRHCLRCGAELVERVAGVEQSVRAAGLSTQQVCKACAGGTWRVVYDRDARIGAVPANLVNSYGREVAI